MHACNSVFQSPSHYKGQNITWQCCLYRQAPVQRDLQSFIHLKFQSPRSANKKLPFPLEPTQLVTPSARGQCNQMMRGALSTDYERLTAKSLPIIALRSCLKLYLVMQRRVAMCALNCWSQNHHFMNMANQLIMETECEPWSSTSSFLIAMVLH